MGIVAQRPVTTFANPQAGQSPMDANVVRGNDNTIKTVYNGHDADTTIHLQNGLVAARPAASIAGQQWLTSDTGAVYLYYDTGSAWVEQNYLRSTGGTVTGLITISAGGLTVSAGTTAVQALTATTGTFSAGAAATIALYTGTTATSLVALDTTGGAATDASELDFRRNTVSTWLVGNNVSNTSDAFTIYSSGVGTAITISHSTRIVTFPTGAVVTAGGLTVTAGGLTVSASGITVTGNSTITGTLGGLTGLTVASGTTAVQALTATTITTTGLVSTPASAAGGAGFRIGSGSAPTTPVLGDVWFDGVNILYRAGGATKTITAV